MYELYELRGFTESRGTTILKFLNLVPGTNVYVHVLTCSTKLVCMPMY